MQPMRRIVGDHEDRPYTAMRFIASIADGGAYLPNAVGKDMDLVFREGSL